MSWIRPTAEEPSHKEFVLAWQSTRNKTIRQVSVALARMGYIDMTPKACWRWYKRLRLEGVNLRRRRRPRQTNAWGKQEQVRDAEYRLLGEVEELSEEEVNAMNRAVPLPRLTPHEVNLILEARRKWSAR